MGSETKVKMKMNIQNDNDNDNDNDNENENENEKRNKKKQHSRRRPKIGRGIRISLVGVIPPHFVLRQAIRVPHVAVHLRQRFLPRKQIVQNIARFLTLFIIHFVRLSETRAFAGNVGPGVHIQRVGTEILITPAHGRDIERHILRELVLAVQPGQTQVVVVQVTRRTRQQVHIIQATTVSNLPLRAHAYLERSLVAISVVSEEHNAHGGEDGERRQFEPAAETLVKGLFEAADDVVVVRACIGKARRNAMHEEE